MNPYVIMTDTTADLPESYIKEHELAILSLSYTIDGTTYDRENPLDVREFYAKMRGGSMPTTAQVNPEQAKEAFKACLEQGKDVLYIAFSSGLSGTYGSAVIAARELEEDGEFPERKVIVIDSLSASLGEGLLVHKAVMLKEAGKSFDEVADEAQPPDLVDIVLLGGNHDDRDVLLLPHLPADLEAVHARKHQIQDHQLKILLQRALQSYFPVGSYLHLKTGKLQIILFQIRNGFFVFYNQYLAHLTGTS